jgi:hypothetical protein
MTGMHPKRQFDHDECAVQEKRYELIKELRTAETLIDNTEEREREAMQRHHQALIDGHLSRFYMHIYTSDWSCMYIGYIAHTSNIYVLFPPYHLHTANEASIRLSP